MLFGLMSLDFCYKIQMVGSEFRVNYIHNMKAWIHPGLYEQLRLLVVMVKPHHPVT